MLPCNILRFPVCARVINRQGHADSVRLAASARLVGSVRSASTCGRTGDGLPPFRRVTTSAYRPVSASTAIRHSERRPRTEVRKHDGLLPTARQAVLRSTDPMATVHPTSAEWPMSSVAAASDMELARLTRSGGNGRPRVGFSEVERGPPETRPHKRFGGPDRTAFSL